MRYLELEYSDLKIYSDYSLYLTFQSIIERLQYREKFVFYYIDPIRCSKPEKWLRSELTL
jgi:hypothetical protein